MLPPKALKLLGKFLRFCSFLHIFPFAFKWNATVEVITVKKSGFRRTFFWSVEVCMVAYQIFVLYRAKQLASLDALPLSVKVKALYMILSFVGMSYNRLVFINHQNELPGLIEGFVEIPRKFAVENKSEPSGDKVSKMVRLVTIPSFVLMTLNVLVAFARPEAPHHVSSIFKEPKGLPKLARVGLGVVQGYINFSQYLTAAFNLTIVVCHIEAILPMVHTLRLAATTGTVPSAGERLTEDQRMRYFNQLRILQGLFNSILSNWALGAQAYFMIGSVVNNFQAVVFFSPRGLIASAILQTLCVLIFKHLGHVWEASAKTLRSWNDVQGSSKVFKKYLRSVRPLRVKIASLYYADYTLVIIILSVIVSNSGGLIVAYKDRHQRC